MTTLRDFILNQSLLPTGNQVRDHINNPSSGGGSSTIAVHSGLESETVNTTEAESVVTLEAEAIETNEAHIITDTEAMS